jgi:hypothetical protein
VVDVDDAHGDGGAVVDVGYDGVGVGGRVGSSILN